jgi:hypothetical protein
LLAARCGLGHAIHSRVNLWFWWKATPNVRNRLLCRHTVATIYLAVYIETVYLFAVSTRTCCAFNTFTICGSYVMNFFVLCCRFLYVLLRFVLWIFMPLWATTPPAAMPFLVCGLSGRLFKTMVLVLLGILRVMLCLVLHAMPPAIVHGIVDLVLPWFGYLYGSSRGLW